MFPNRKTFNMNSKDKEPNNQETSLYLKTNNAKNDFHQCEQMSENLQKSWNLFHKRETGDF